LSNRLFELDSFLTIVEGCIRGSCCDTDSKPHDSNSGMSEYFFGITEVFSKLKVVFIRYKDIIHEDVSVLHQPEC
jgi:hypothetical protein